MHLRLYNTLSKQKEVFTPQDINKISMYVCGPTVYDYAHIGNARPVVVFDTLFRVLRHLYGEASIHYARNITDIDDKIINCANDTRQHWQTITTKYELAFNDDMAKLNALPVNYAPKATDHIADMINMITILLEKKHAYIAQGHVLFHVPSMPNYGVLSKRKQEDQQAGARVEVASYKKHHADFVLWKPSKQGEPSWQTPWQSDIASAGHISGRPGWHIECSAMNHAIFGETIDIHGGGSDLVFPHHENECAQSMCAFDNDVYAKYWLHNAFVTINGEKMSKSLANFITVHELLEKHNISGEVIRYVLLSAHYRQPVDWNDNNIQQAQNNLDYLYNCLHNMADKTVTPDLNSLDIEPLLDDLNTPLALQKLQSYANSLNKNYDSVLHGKMLGLANSMGLLYQQPKSWFQGNATDTQVIEQLIAQRQQARAGRDFIKADAIRKSLLQDHNVLLDDQPSGTTWKYNNEQ